MQTCLSSFQTDNVAGSPSLTVLSDPPYLRRTVKFVAVDYNVLTAGHSQSGVILNVDGVASSGAVVTNPDVCLIFIYFSFSVKHAESSAAGEDLVLKLLLPLFLFEVF